MILVKRQTGHLVGGVPDSTGHARPVPLGGLPALYLVCDGPFVEWGHRLGSPFQAERATSVINVCDLGDVHRGLPTLQLKDVIIHVFP